MQTNAERPTDDRALRARPLRDAALITVIGLHQLHAAHVRVAAAAVVRAPRAVLIAGGVAAAAGLAALVHFTGFVPGAGAVALFPQARAIAAPDPSRA